MLRYRVLQLLLLLLVAPAGSWCTADLNFAEHQQIALGEEPQTNQFPVPDPLAVVALQDPLSYSLQPNLYAPFVANEPQLYAAPQPLKAMPRDVSDFSATWTQGADAFPQTAFPPAAVIEDTGAGDLLERAEPAGIASQPTAVVGMRRLLGGLLLVTLALWIIKDVSIASIEKGGQKTPVPDKKGDFIPSLLSTINPLLGLAAKEIKDHITPEPPPPPSVSERAFSHIRERPLLVGAEAAALALGLALIILGLKSAFTRSRRSLRRTRR